MKNVAELHTEHKELTSEILFLRKEISFLLHLVKNGYSSSVNNEKIKLLDAYWKGFEENIASLDLLLKKIIKEEQDLAHLYQDNLIDGNKTLFKEVTNLSEFNLINKTVKTLKESFYEYMSGCCACSFKN